MSYTEDQRKTQQKCLETFILILQCYSQLLFPNHDHLKGGIIINYHYELLLVLLFYSWLQSIYYFFLLSQLREICDISNSQLNFKTIFK